MYGIYVCAYVLAHVSTHMYEGTLVWVNVHQHECRVQKLTLNTFSLSPFTSLTLRLAIQLA